MFQPRTIRYFSVVAIVLSVIGLVLSILLLKLQGFRFILGIATWLVLLWTSYLGFRLSSYKLYEDEFRKVGIRMYLIIAAFLLFLFVGVIGGLGLSIVLLSGLWGLKKNYDEWDYSETVQEAPVQEEGGSE